VKISTNQKITFVLVAYAVMFSGSLAQADENLFGYTYGSETLPKGGLEFYEWITGRQDKGGGRYDALDLQTELEYGVTDRFQVSGYINFEYHDINNSAPYDSTGASEFENKNSSFAWSGGQAEFKYAVLSPYKDNFGLALYLEPGYSRVDKITGEHGNEYELEFKLILQKNFLDDQLIWAANISPEFEREKMGLDTEWENHFLFEVSTGLSYRFAPNWYAGLEARYDSEYPNNNLGNREHWALFAGPNIHYAAKDWWWTLTFLPQIQGRPDNTVSGLQLDEHERYEWRLKIGYNF